MHPALMTALAEERHAAMLRAGETQRLARLAKPRRGRASAVRPPQLPTGLATLRRYAPAERRSTAVCCA